MKIPTAWKAALLLTFSHSIGMAITLTDLQGRTLEGEPVSATDDAVTIRRTSDKKILKIQLDTVKQEDRTAVQSWRIGQAVSKLKLAGVKNRLASDSKSDASFSPGSVTDVTKSSNSTDRVQSWQWTLKITNTSNVPIKGLTVNYSQVVERVKRGEGKSKVQNPHGKLEIPDIPPFGTVTVQTQAVEVRSHKSVSSSKTGSSEAQYTVDKWDEALTGLGVVVRHASATSLEWHTGTDPGPVP